MKRKIFEIVLVFNASTGTDVNVKLYANVVE